MADNGVNIENTPNILIITDSDQNQVIVTQPITNVIEVNTPGPKGPQGDQGPSGSQGPPGDELFTELSASLYYTTSSLQVTGSISITGGVSGSFSGSGVDLFDIPATAITGLNLSQIASGSYTASISPDAGFIVNTSSSISGNLNVNETLYVDRIEENTPNNPLTIGSPLVIFESSSVLITGSLTVSGSSTFTNIGPAVFSGSVVTTDVFTGSGAGLFDIPASGITGLNLSQIASGSTTASISPDLGFQVNTSSSITGSLSVSGIITGSGAGLYDVPSTAIVGLNLSQIASGSSTASISPDSGFQINTDTKVTGSLIVTGISTFTGAITGNGGFLGNLTGTASAATTASLAVDVINKGGYTAGIISGSDWTNNLNGTVTVPTVIAALYNNPNFFEPLNLYTVQGGTSGTDFAALTNNDTNYVYINYNNGNPVFDVTTDYNIINGSDKILDLIIYRADNFIHVLEFGNQGAGLSNKLNNRVISTDRFARESGLNLVLDTSNGVATASAGIAWDGSYRQSLNEINSVDDIFFRNYHSASVWVYDTTQNYINNSIYDDGNFTQSISPGKYLTNWYYRGQEVNDHIYEIVSQGEYDSFAEAQLATEPNPPELITSHAFLMGRIIVQSGSYSGSVESAFSTVFQPTTVTSHNDLTNIQGGTAGEYYHLTDTQYQNLALQNNSASFQGSISASEFTGSGLGITNARIGLPTDGTYNDGFFDTFTTATKLSDALDEISLAFLDLAPAKASVLTGTNLTRFNPAVFTGNLSAGLNPQWYATASAFTQYTTLTSATNVDLRANGTRAGKASDISASLFGGVSSSRAYGTNTFSVVDIRPLSSGLGSTNTIDIDGLRVFNTFWAIVTSSIDDTINQTGSVQYRVSADNGAGSTSPFQLFYVGGAGDYPNQSISSPTCVTSSTTFNYLSGITMLRGATFTIGFTGSNVFNPVYNLNQCSLTSSFFSTLTTGSNTPQWNDILQLTVTRTLAATTHSGQSTGTGNITISKPGKSNVATSYTLSNSYINSYTSAQSTNNNNTQNDIFVDEAQRYTNLQTAGWASGSSLVDGNLQVQNARLIVGRWGDYGAFLSGSTSAATSYANYFRNSIPGTTNRIGGTFSILRNTNAFAASTPISAWGSGGRLEAVLVLKADITGPETANFYYDLGRAVGANSGNIIGIRNTITTNNTTTYTVTWALPGGVSTGANGCVIWIRYRNTPNTDFIRSLTITYS